MNVKLQEVNAREKLEGIFLKFLKNASTLKLLAFVDSMLTRVLHNVGLLA